MANLSLEEANSLLEKQPAPTVGGELSLEDANAAVSASVKPQTYSPFAADAILGTDVVAPSYPDGGGGSALWPKNLGESVLSSVGLAEAGIRSSFWKEQLDQTRREREMYKKMNEDPRYAGKFSEKVKELEAAEQEDIANFLEAQTLWAEREKYRQSIVPEGEGTIPTAIRTAAESMPPMAAAAMAFALRQPRAAIGLGAGGGLAQAYGRAYGEVAGALPHETAHAYASVQSLLEFAGDALGLKVLSAQGKKVLGRYITAIAVGGAEESGSEMVQGVHEMLTANPNLTVKEVLERMKIAFLAGGGTYGLTAAGIRAGEKVAEAAEKQLAFADLGKSLTEKVPTLTPEDVVVTLMDPARGYGPMSGMTPGGTALPGTIVPPVQPSSDIPGLPQGPEPGLETPPWEPAPKPTFTTPTEDPDSESYAPKKYAYPAVATIESDFTTELVAAAQAGKFDDVAQKIWENRNALLSGQYSPVEVLKGIESAEPGRVPVGSWAELRDAILRITDAFIARDLSAEQEQIAAAKAQREALIKSLPTTTDLAQGFTQEEALELDLVDTFLNEVTADKVVKALGAPTQAGRKKALDRILSKFLLEPEIVNTPLRHIIAQMSGLATRPGSGVEPLVDMHLSAVMGRKTMLENLKLGRPPAGKPQAPMTALPQHYPLKNPNTVWTVDQKAKINTERIVASLTRWQEKFFKKLGITTEIEIEHDTQGNFGSMRVTPTLDGYHLLMTLDLTLLESANPTSVEKAIETTAHEFGHAMLAIYYDKASTPLRDAIKALYTAYIHRVVRMDLREGMAVRRGPAGARAEHEFETYFSIGEKVADELLRSASALTYGAHTLIGYRWSFDEFLAHQTERAFARDFRGMAADVKQFFLSGVKALKLLFAGVKAEMPTYEKTFEEWLNAFTAEVEAEGAKERINAYRADGVELAWDGTSAPPGTPLKLAREVELSISEAPPPPENWVPEGLNNWGTTASRKLGIQPNGHPVGQIDRFGKVREWFATLIGIAKANPHIRELSDRTGPLNPETGFREFGYLEWAQFYANERAHWISLADERLRSWRKLGRKQQKLVGDLQLEETVNGVFFTDEELVARGLTPGALLVYQGIRRDFASFYEALRDALIQKATRLMGASNPMLPGRVNKIRSDFAQALKVPYFPLSRFGKWLVVVRDSEGQLIDFEATDFAFESIKLKKDLERHYGAGFVVKRDAISEAQQAFMGIPRGVLEALRSELSLTPEQEVELDQLILKYAPENSFVKRLMERKKTKGWSLDAQRAYAKYFFSGAGHMAKSQYIDGMRDAARRIHASATAMDEDSVVRRQIANMISSHLEETINPGADWAGFRSLLSTLTLGGVLRTITVNLTQVPNFTYPYLAARYGDGAAIAALAKAYRDVPKMSVAARKLTPWENNALTKWATQKPLTKKEEKFVAKWTGLTIEEHQDVERAMREQVLDQSYAMELAAYANGAMLMRMQFGGQNPYLSEGLYYARAAHHGLMMPFEIVEKMNRRVSFIAARRLAEKAGLAGESLYQAAIDGVRTTQFEYSKWARPKVLKGRRGAFLLFYQYQLNALAFYMGGDPGWWRALAVLFAMGGILGLPFAQNILDVASWMFQKLNPNKKVDLEREAKLGSKALFGDGADLFLHGVSRYGFGPLWWADLSGSVSMGRPIPGTEFLNKTQSFDQSVVRMGESFAGVPASLALRTFRGLTEEGLDMDKRAEMLMPYDFARNAMTALRWYRDGAERLSNDARVLTFDPADPKQLLEIVGKAGGFQPRAMATGDDGRGLGREFLSTRNEMVRFYEARRQALMKMTYDAVMDGDMEEQRLVLDEIGKYNDDVPAGVLKIGPELIQSVRQRAKRALLEETSGTTRRERGVHLMMEEEENR